ncbi:hypothetical protein E0H73_28610 [Kribbella pittospori]|uniref:PPE domain-containing protein n=1 Tax=Kribbella pittospori TaxID=722689 RepID=A0A4R0KJV6_9ACTN|nr:hypothetical protein [Kribbella pittospori]TCC58278.1 hypothetical protein E0H73_28610 [Kribbella pittospori]
MADDMAGRLAELQKMLEALDKEAVPGVRLVQTFGGWWTALTKSISTSQQSLAAARSGLRRGLTGNTGEGWLDQAGDSFDTRWKLADDSLTPWATAAGMDAGVVGTLNTEITTTRTMVQAAIDAIVAEQANAASAASSGSDSLQDRVRQSNASIASAPLIRAADAAYQAAVAQFKKLDEQFAQVGTSIEEMPPETAWNGPMGTTGQPPATSPAVSPQAPVRSSSPTGPSAPGAPAAPGGPSDAATDPSADPSASSPPGGSAGGDPGSEGGVPTGTEGPGLAGIPPAGTPTLPPGLGNLPPGLGNLPPTPTPPQVPVMPPGVPYPPAASLNPLPPNGKGANPGLGKSVIGAGGKLGAFGSAKYDLGGVDVAKGIQDTTANGPAQAARQMNSRPLPTVQPAPAPPAAATAATAGPAATGASSTPPPMMPPMMGTGGGGTPKPGTAAPVMPGKSKPATGLPGVPPKLRGRSGKNDQAFGVPSVPRRRKAMEAEKADTVQLLDEELWTVEQPAAPSTPAADRKALRNH